MLVGCSVTWLGTHNYALQMQIFEELGPISRVANSLHSYKMPSALNYIPQ